MNMRILITCFLVGLSGMVCWQQTQITSLRQGIERLDLGGGNLIPAAIHSASPPLATTAIDHKKNTAGGLEQTNPFIKKFRPDSARQEEALTNGSFREAILAHPLELNGGAAGPLATPVITLEQAEEQVKSKPVVAGKGPGWSHQQVTGPPDTKEGGDIVTAWAPRRTQSGEQWIQLGYEQAVEISGINVHETYCPGAMSKVTALMPDGSERILWSGSEPHADPKNPAEVWVPAPSGVTSKNIRVYVDTDRVTSWPEIDAVELVGKMGVRQWATSSSASSYYGDPQSIVEDSAQPPATTELLALPDGPSAGVRSTTGAATATKL